MNENCGMKRNTIKLLLNKKIEDWLTTIEDEVVKGAIKRDLIVTGGCIASMLLGEKINDYDFYFRTVDTAELVARYYCRVFNSTVKVENAVRRSVQPVVKRLFATNIKGKEEDRVTIWIQSAGVVSEQQSEYHYFESLDESDADKFAESLAADLKPDKKAKYRPVYFSQNAVTLSDKIQLIIRFSGEPEIIHESFDYVHATCWYDYAKKELVLPQEALEALLSRTLIYRGSLYPLASVFRIRKFIERGWRITAGQILKILWQVSELDLNDRALLNDQLIGVDQAYMYQLIQALKNAPDKVDASYIAKILDGIFE